MQENLLNPIRERWNMFLNKIEERFHETLTQAQQLLPQVLDLQNFDTKPILVAWSGIENQAKQLISKIQDTWHEKVDPSLEEFKELEENKLEENGGSLDEFYTGFNFIYCKEQDRGIETSYKLEKALKSYEVKTLAEIGRKLQLKAHEILSGNFNCSQCKAPLPVQKNFFRAYYQTCDYCQTVNTFEPGTIARNVEHFALHAIAEEQAIDNYFVYADIERLYKNQRDDEPRKISAQQVLDSYLLYLDVYLKARIAIIPEYEKRYKKDRAAKLEQLRKWSLSDDFSREFTFLSKEQISDLFCDIADCYFIEDPGEPQEQLSIALISLKDYLEYFIEAVEEAFGLTIPSPETKTIGSSIEWLFEHRENIKLGWNVSDNIEWYGWFDYDEFEDDENFENDHD
jgi:hypothetical protein